MSVTETTVASLIRADAMQSYRLITRRFVKSRYNIESGELANIIVREYAPRVHEKVSQSKKLTDKVLSQLSEEEQLSDVFSNEISNKIDEIVMKEIETGTTILDELDSVITPDEIRDKIVDVTTEQVSDTPNFNPANASDFAMSLNNVATTDLVSALKTKNFDALLEYFEDTLY